MNWHIDIELKANRYLPGWLILLIDGLEVLRTPCLGIADRQAAAQHGNPSADPLHENGDTPTGEYTGRWIALHPPAFSERSYGTSGAIELTPVSGDCLIAQQNGRSGLLIHSGDLGTNPNVLAGLRPTHGCCRVGPTGMDSIMTALQSKGPGTVSIREIA